MDKKTISTLTKMRDALADPLVAQHVDAVAINNPAQEVEKSLVSFVTHRLEALQKNIDFEDTIKETIFSRIGEATFPQLLSLLEVLQSGNIQATRAMLAPFTAQDGGKTLPETLRTADRDEGSAAKQIYEDTEDKKMLQAMMALTQLVDGIKSVAAADTGRDSSDQ